MAHESAPVRPCLAFSVQVTFVLVVFPEGAAAHTPLCVLLDGVWPGSLPILADWWALKRSPGFGFGFSLTDHTKVRCSLVVEFLCAFEGHPWDNSSRGIVEPKGGLEILVAVAK